MTTQLESIVQTFSLTAEDLEDITQPSADTRSTYMFDSLTYNHGDTIVKTLLDLRGSHPLLVLFTGDGILNNVNDEVHYFEILTRASGFCFLHAALEFNRTNPLFVKLMTDVICPEQVNGLIEQKIEAIERVINYLKAISRPQSDYSAVLSILQPILTAVQTGEVKGMIPHMNNRKSLALIKQVLDPKVLLQHASEPAEQKATTGESISTEQHPVITETDIDRACMGAEEVYGTSLGVESEDAFAVLDNEAFPPSLYLIVGGPKYLFKKEQQRDEQEGAHAEEEEEEEEEIKRVCVAYDPQRGHYARILPQRAFRELCETAEKMGVKVLEINIPKEKGNGTEHIDGEDAS